MAEREKVYTKIQKVMGWVWTTYLVLAKLKLCHCTTPTVLPIRKLLRYLIKAWVPFLSQCMKIQVLAVFVLPKECKRQYIVSGRVCLCEIFMYFFVWVSASEGDQDIPSKRGKFALITDLKQTHGRNSIRFCSLRDGIIPFVNAQRTNYTDRNQNV